METRAIIPDQPEIPPHEDNESSNKDRFDFQLRELFNGSNDLIQITDTHGKLLFVNESWRYKMGFKENDLKSKSFFDLVQNDRRKELDNVLNSLSVNTPSKRLETVLINQNGRKIYLSGQITGIFTNDEITQFQGVFYDISERVRTESVQKLFFSIATITHKTDDLEELYSLIFKELSNHLKIRNFSVLISGPTGHYFPYRINEKSKKKDEVDKLLSDYTLTINKPMIIYSEGIKKIAEQYHKQLNTEIPKIWLGVPFESEDALKGVIMMYSYRDQSLFNHKDLELLDFISVQVGLALGRRQTHQALIQSEEKFRNIFESFQDIYFRCDLKGKITMVSPSVKEVLGYETSEVLSKSIDQFFISKKTTKKLLIQLRNKSRVQNFDGEVRTKDKKQIQFLCNVRLIQVGDQGVPEIEGVARDVTELKQTNKALKSAKELAEKSLKIKERFLANMSHEIRTPMNGIIGMIDLLGTTSLDDEQSEYIRTIQKSSDTLLNILNDILDLSKIEAGKMELRKDPVKLVETFEKIYDLYSQQAYQNDTNLYYHLDDELPEYVLADETRLMQVISNLTSNAIKFSDKKGTINLSIKVLKETKTYHEFRISVKDSGIGIHPDDQKKLFTSFNQIDSSKRKQFGGTGLGLAISRELVTSMKGKIGLVSTPGFGSTFWFTFRTQKMRGKPTLNAQEDVGLKQFVDKQPRILLVDDNDINRKVASQILIKSGCLVEVAESGFTAIDKVKNQLFDLIFMDIQMPELDGVETTNIIRELGLDNVPPIVAMTAYSMEEDRDRFLNQGMDDYLPKPIKSYQIVEKIRQWTQYEPKIAETVLFKEQTEDLIINQNTLNQLHKYGGSELIESVLADFKEEAEQQIEVSEKAFLESDYDELRKQMHTLKGNSGTLGIEKLSRQAAIVEKSVKEDKFEVLESELTHLKRTYEEFNENYHNLLKNE